MPPEEDYEVTWNPSRAQLARYLAREAELCARVRAKRPALRQTDTLFSAHTWRVASTMLALEASAMRRAA